MSVVGMKKKKSIENLRYELTKKNEKKNSNLFSQQNRRERERVRKARMHINENSIKMKLQVKYICIYMLEVTKGWYLH